MRVLPSLLNHPKFQRLRRMVGDRAAEYLLRIWGHCEENQKGELWVGANDEYVEIVCAYTGENGILFRSLVNCGFLDQKRNGVLVHDWNATNSRAVSNWELGTREKKNKRSQSEANGKPRLSQREANGKPTRSRMNECMKGTPIVPNGDIEEVSEQSDSGVESLPSEPDFEKKEKGAGIVDLDGLERARGLFRMRAGTPLDASQARAWRKAAPAVRATAERDWLALEWWFGIAADSPLARFRRKDLAQLLNNWNGEIERAHTLAHQTGAEILPRLYVVAWQPPEDWADILRGECPEFNPPARFAELPESIRRVVRDFDDRRKAGGA
jgi:hypothetical protein